MINPEHEEEQEVSENEDVEQPSQASEDGAPSKEDLKEVLDITRQVRDKLSETEPAKGLSSADLREQIKEQTGMTDSQIDFTLNTANNAALNAAGPAMAELAIANMYRDKPDFKEFEKDVRDELEKYPLAKRGDKELIEKIYFMSKGKRMSTTSTSKSTNHRPENPRGAVNKRIVSDGGISDRDLGGADNGRADSKELTQAEKTVARKMGLSEKEYARAKNETIIANLK